jgi:hypothetical protein
MNNDGRKKKLQYVVCERVFWALVLWAGTSVWAVPRVWAAKAYSLVATTLLAIPSRLSPCFLSSVCDSLSPMLRRPAGGFDMQRGGDLANSQARRRNARRHCSLRSTEADQRPADHGAC